MMGYAEQSEDGPNIVRQISKLQDELDLATATINEMQNLLKPWMNPNNSFGRDLTKAYSLGVNFNSTAFEAFNRYLEMKKKQREESPPTQGNE